VHVDETQAGSTLADYQLECVLLLYALGTVAYQVAWHTAALAIASLTLALRAVRANSGDPAIWLSLFGGLLSICVNLVIRFEIPSALELWEFTMAIFVESWFEGDTYAYLVRDTGFVCAISGAILLASKRRLTFLRVALAYLVVACLSPPVLFALRGRSSSYDPDSASRWFFLSGIGSLQFFPFFLGSALALWWWGRKRQEEG
jgi:hypothetical protein